MPNGRADSFLIRSVMSFSSRFRINGTRCKEHVFRKFKRFIPFTYQVCAAFVQHTYKEDPMEALFWGLEFTKVLFCYIFVLFLWPSVVFRKYLHNKSKIFRFCFCVTTQIVLITTTVLLLGLLYLLNAWVVNILFYGTFLLSLKEYIMPNDEQKKEIHRLMRGSIKLRYFIFRRLSDIRNWVYQTSKKVWKAFRAHAVEYSLLMAVVAFGVIYFSHASLHDNTYGYGDLYVHHSWINGLIDGTIFYDGIYPEGMHCVIYLMHTISGTTVYSCILFLGGIHIAVILLSIYCLMREIFRSRYTPIFIIAAFVIVGLYNVDGVSSISRLQSSVPFEYGMYTHFLCAMFLLRFLKEQFERDWHREWQWLHNDNLMLFLMSLAASIAIHFYVTIMAFFLCLPFAIVYIRRVLSRTRFSPLVSAVVCGVMIAATPMGIALLTGTHFQGSINWAIGVMQSSDEEEDVTQGQQQGQQQNQQQGQQIQENVADNTQGQGGGAVIGGIQSPGEAPVKDSLLKKLGNYLTKLGNYLKKVWNNIRYKLIACYNIGYQNSYGLTSSMILASLSIVLMILWLLYRIICKLFRAADSADAYDNYIPIIVASFIFMLLYVAPYIKLPVLVPNDRLFFTVHILIITIAFMPVDIVLSSLQLFCTETVMRVTAAVCAAVLYVGTIVTGNYHGYLMCEMTRYKSVADVTTSITRTLPKNTYTIVSSTDDLHIVSKYGRHEELVNFLGVVDREERYYLPTEYVFVYVEKRPIINAQYHFSSGPSWLATDDYADNIFAKYTTSKYPEVLATDITGLNAGRKYILYRFNYDSYKDPTMRTIINSKASQWCKAFTDMYSIEMKVYYEDDDFICYYFRQNPNALFNLAIDY